MDQDVRALAQALATDPTPGENVYVRRAVVTDLAIQLGRAQILMGGTYINNVPIYRGVDPIDGDVVDVLMDNGSPIIIGCASYVGNAPRLIGYGIVSNNTGGSCLGTYANTLGAGVVNYPVTTTEQDLKLGLVVMPVRASRVIRVDYQFVLADVPNGQYQQFFLNVAWNGGSYSHMAAHQYVGSSGAFSLAAKGEFLVVTPSTAGTMSCYISAQTTGGTAYVYRYSTSNSIYRSSIEAYDISPAIDYLAQTGTAP